MTDAFDPYHIWLGIPPKEQPPNHYRLLGIQLFESEPRTITNAADSRMEYLHARRQGEHAELAKQLLLQVAAAKVCLLHQEKKAAYDRDLRQRRSNLENTGQKFPAPSPVRPVRRTARWWFKPVVAIVASAAVVLLIGNLVVDNTRPVRNPSPSVAMNSDKPEKLPSSPQQPSNSTADKEPASVRRDKVLVGRPPADVAERQINGGRAEADEQAPDAAGNSDTRAGSGRDKKSPETAEENGATTAEPQPAEAPTGTTLPEKTEQKLPVPSQDEQRQATQLLAEVFEPESRKKPKEKIDLAKELLEMAKKLADATERFVVLAKAMELAGEGGDARLMLQVVDAVVAQYDVDALEAKQKALEVFAGAADDSTRIQALVENTKPLIEQAVAQQRYELALNLADTAYRVCQKARGKQYRKSVHELREMLKELLGEYEELLAARKALETDPDQPDANLVVGRWYCFERGDWQKGLPYLAKSGDERLQRLAKQDLAVNSEGVDNIIARADAWWRLAESKEADEKTAILLRAGHWYRQAQAKGLEGLVKLKVEKRLRAIGSIKPPGLTVPETPPPKSAVAPLPRGLVGHWKFDERRGNRAADSIGRAHGKLLGNPTWIKGRIGGALSFDGKDDWVDAGIYPTLPQYTLSTFVRVTAATEQTCGMIICLRSKQDKHCFNVSLFVKHGSTRAKQVAVHHLMLQQEKYVALLSKTNIINTGWHHVVASYDGKEYKIYVDGTLEGSRGGGPPRLDGNQSLLFGSHALYPNPPGVRKWFHGAIDDVQLYNRALSDAEIRSLYRGMAK